MKKSILSAALLVFSCLSLVAQTYSVTDLGTLGGSSSAAYGINNSGQVVGSAMLANGTTHGTLFSEVGTPNVDLGTIAGLNSVAYSINDAGSIVGYSTDSGGARHAVAFRYPGRSIFDLGSLGQPGASAYSINNNDRVVGDGRTNTGYPAARFSGFGANNSGLLGVSNNNSSGVAYSINSSNRVVGYSLNDSGIRRATAFSESFGLGQDLGGLVSGGSSQAYGINDPGQVVGYASVSNGYFHAVRFASGGFATIDLGTLGGNTSVAYSINNAGTIVGSSTIAGETPHGFICTNNVMTDLNSLINPALGVVVSEARDINEAGQIAANGTINGVAHALRLDFLPPPPPPVVTFRIFLKATPPKKGTVLGGMDYPTGTLVTVTARPKRGGVFLNWVEKGKIVSKSRVYRFKATKPRNLIARFR